MKSITKFSLIFPKQPKSKIKWLASSTSDSWLKQAIENPIESKNQIENSIFIEDTAKNLRPAKLLGLKTVWMENERNLEDYKENSEYVDLIYSDLKSFLNDITY